MARVTRSNRGEVVDFDLLELKQKINSAPKTEKVVERERFIDKKRRRTSGARKINQMLGEQAENQRYAKEMIDAARAAKKIEDENAPPADSIVAAVPLPAPTPVEETPTLDQPKRINRRVR